MQFRPMRWWIRLYGPLVVLTGVLVIYNEFFIFFNAFRKCQWPCANGSCSEESLKVFMISDTHLLGQRKGHWLDKLKREWQMRQSFRIATWLQNPDAVFFLGDLTDEGQWAGRSLFTSYADRFRELFAGRKVITLAGNHDLGFHYAIMPETLSLFEEEFRRGLIDEIELKNQRFVLINSMAMHGDGCKLCHDAEVRLEEIQKASRGKPRPIVLQHFPLHRKSDAECDKVDDEHEIDEKEQYREQWDTLSEESTRKIIGALNPKAVFGGHTHKMCKKLWKSPKMRGFYEYTVNSFSWRNGDVPALLMVVVDGDAKVAVNSCRLPSERLQIAVYIVGAVAILLLAIILTFRRRYLFRRRLPHLLLTHHSRDQSKCE